jgi:hypothetical protein
MDSDTTELMVAGLPRLTSSTMARMNVCRMEKVFEDLVPPHEEIYLKCRFHAAMVSLATLVSFIS